MGAGFGGLGMLHRLRRRGVTGVVVLEASDRLGGTWRDNTYPGSQCDIPSNLYSLSFAPNPSWSTTFPRQPEIEAYIDRAADDHGLRKQVRFGCRLRSAKWRESANCWVLHTTLGPMTAGVLILATGFLSEPALPEITDLERYAGPVFHTAQWDHAVELAGKRIAVVGTGASAVQLIPEIAPTAAHVDVYQRTPSWILPHFSRRVTGAEQWIYRHLPVLQRLRRLLTYLFGETRRRTFSRPGVTNRLARSLALWNIRLAIRDRDLVARVTPDYDFGCKRVLLSNRFYRSLAREDVDLINCPVTSATSSGLVDGDGVERPADVVVLATGFRISGRSLYGRISGIGGRTLGDAVDRSGAYLGTVASGFPNLFLVGGPATGPAYTSFLFMLESQHRYIADAIASMKRFGWQVIDVRREVHKRYDERLQAAMDGTVWASDCSNWFLDHDGRNHAIWPGSSWSFRRRTRRFDPAAYHIDQPSPRLPRRPGADMSESTR